MGDEITCQVGRTRMPYKCHRKATRMVDTALWRKPACGAHARRFEGNPFATVTDLEPASRPAGEREGGQQDG